MNINPQRSLLPARIPMIIASLFCLFLGGCGANNSFPVGTWKNEEDGAMANVIQLYTITPDHKGKILINVISSIMGNQSSEATLEGHTMQTH